MSSNIYTNLPHICSDSDSEEREWCSTNTSKVVIKNEDIKSLYNYFFQIGKKDGWRISKSQVIASLIRNKGDYIKSGKDIESLMDREDFDIRYFYVIDENFKRIFRSDMYKTSRPYLVGQKWLKYLRKGTHVLFEKKVYNITYFNNGYIYLEHNLSKEVRYFLIDEDRVISGKITYIPSKYIQLELKKELDLIEREYYDKIQTLDDSDKRYFETSQKIYTEIQMLKTQHQMNCRARPKIDVLIFMRIFPIEIIRKIASYGLQNDHCNHVYDIERLEERDEMVDDAIRRNKYHSDDAKYDYEKAYHIFHGSFEEWLRKYDSDEFY